MTLAIPCAQLTVSKPDDEKNVIAQIKSPVVSHSLAPAMIVIPESFMAVQPQALLLYARAASQLSSLEQELQLLKDAVLSGKRTS